jgi:D-alanyl-D-alanine dipeptidase
VMARTSNLLISSLKVFLIRPEPTWPHMISKAPDRMWDLIRDESYVSNPAKNRGRHTRGTAVDVTLVDKRGKALPMPTDFDDFSERAHSDWAGASAPQKENRALLQEAMSRFGFEIYPFEWWHFDFHGWQSYSPLDLNFRDMRK